jgi:hypothetical protein
MNNSMFSKEKIDELSKLAGQKTGIDGGVFKDALQNGTLDKLLSKLPPTQARQVQSLLKNPAQAEKLLSNPKAQEILKSLTNNK